MPNKFTPAPWEVVDSDIIGNGGVHIASVSTVDDFPCISEDNASEVALIEAECKGNARLIAAAPELLAFARETLAQTVCLCSLAGIQLAMGTNVECTNCRLKKLIRKVEGE